MNYKKDAFLNTVGNFAYLGSLWLMSVLVVKMGDFRLAGLFSLAMTTSNIYVSIASYTVRLYYAADIENRYSDKQYFLMRIVTTLASLVICVIGSVIIGYTAYQLTIILLFYLYKMLEMMSDILFGAMQRSGKLYFCGYSMTAKSILSLIVFIVILYFTKDLVAVFIAMDIVALLVLVLIDLIYIKKLNIVLFPYNKEDFKMVKKLLICCLPLLVVGICYNLVASVPRLFFERIYSEAEFGILSSLTTITVLISTAVNCVVIPIIPKFAEKYKENNWRWILKSVLIIVALIMLLGAAALGMSALCGKWALSLLFGEEIVNYMSVFNMVIISTLFTSVVICLNSIFSALDKQKILIYSCLASTVFCIGLGYPLCKLFYMNGVAFNLIISQGICIAILAVFFIKIMLKMKHKEVKN